MPRPRAWADTLLGTTIAGSQSNTDLLLELSAADTATVVRLIGRLWFGPVADPTAGYTLQRIDIGDVKLKGDSLPKESPLTTPQSGEIMSNRAPV